MRLSLARPFRVTELREALRALPGDNCPGVDGLSAGFFVSFWELLGEDQCACIQEIVDSGCMPPAFSEGLIYLIPKGEGISDDIRQWRPITILCTVYKILAKVLSLRLQPLLGELIHST